MTPPLLWMRNNLKWRAKVTVLNCCRSVSPVSIGKIKGVLVVDGVRCDVIMADGVIPMLKKRSGRKSDSLGHQRSHVLLQHDGGARNQYQTPIRQLDLNGYRP